MGANAHVPKWDSSLAVRIPEAVAEQCGMSEGPAMETEAQESRSLIQKEACDLAEMLDGITADNLHSEQDFGEPRGNEHW